MTAMMRLLDIGFSGWNILDRAKHGQLSATACVSNLRAAD